MSVRSPKSSQESVKAVRGLWYQQSMMGRTCEKGRFEPGGERGVTVLRELDLYYVDLYYYYIFRSHKMT